jgi:hypothetical protein
VIVHRAALVGAAAWLSVLLGCSADWRGDAFEREATRVASALITPEGAKLLEQGAKHRAATQVIQTWHLRTGPDWQKYSAGVEETLRSAYGCVREGAAIWCTRRAPGDLFRLSVEGRPEGDGVRVKAELRGMPD